jgi:hypothetical protein
MSFGHGLLTMQVPYGDWTFSGPPMLTDRAFACLLIAALLLAGAAREIVSSSRRSADAANTRQGVVGCEHASPKTGSSGCRIASRVPSGAA